MKVTVFGANGGTGRHVVDLALAAGHEVIAAVRNPSAVPVGRERLTAVQADVRDPASVERALAGSDAVVSVLGVADRRKPTTVFSEGVANMLRAMKANGPRRIVALSADGVEPNPHVGLGQRLVTQYIVARIFRYLWGDMLAMERELANSDTDWTAIRAPRLTDGRHTRKYRVRIGEPIQNSSGISRADLADCIVKLLDDSGSYRKVAWISY